jgi:hypothetical protein
MATNKKKIVSVDAKAGRAAIVSAGRKARGAAAKKVGAGAKTARRKGKSAARGLVARASEARQAVESRARGHRDAAIRTALRACVDISSRQLEALKKLENGLDRR